MKPSPLTLCLVLANAVLAASLLSLGQARALPWNDEGVAAVPLALPEVAASLEPLPDALLASAWQRPLLSPNRQPDAPPTTEVAAGLEGITLSGVVIDGQAQWALLRLANHTPLKLKRGDALAGGWALASMSASSATFIRQGQARTLNIPVLRLPAPGTSPVLKRLDVNTHDRD